MALFDATRPTGDPFATASLEAGSAGQWAGRRAGFRYGGAARTLYGENDSALGARTFSGTVGNARTPSIVGIVVELFRGT